MRVDRPERSERPSGAALEVRVLGPFEVLVGGTRVDAGGPKRSEVVALLALHAGRVVTVDTLADALWGAHGPRNARNALQHHVARLRKVLGAASIVSAGNGYALAGGVVDALVFAERLDAARAALRSAMPRRAVEVVDEALGLWRGPALAGFLDSAWAVPRRDASKRSASTPWRTDSTPRWHWATTPRSSRRSEPRRPITRFASACGAN